MMNKQRSKSIRVTAVNHLKEKSKSQKRIIKLEKISFQIEAKKLRQENNNRHILNDIKSKQISKSNRKMLTQIESQRIGKFLEPTKIISVTAHKWVIYDYFSSKYIRGYRARDQQELNTFSKLLVFCAINTIIRKYEIDTQRFQTIALEPILKMFSTKSLLDVDDIVSLQDLMHLMLMEQNQIYEIILAANIGSFLQKKRVNSYYSVFDTIPKNLKVYMNNFYDLVNSYCKLLCLQTIKYIESDPRKRRQNNKGSPTDIAILSIQCLKIPLFTEIIKKIDHKVKIQYINNEGNLNTRGITIVNRSISNKFIPYLNICRNWQKQNFMNSHGSLLIQYKNYKLKPIVVVLLGCYGPSDRQKDIQQISQWYLKNGAQEIQVSPRKGILLNSLGSDEQKIQQKRKSTKIRTSGNIEQIINSKTLNSMHNVKRDGDQSSKYDKYIIKKLNSGEVRLKTQM